MIFSKSKSELPAQASLHDADYHPRSPSPSSCYRTVFARDSCLSIGQSRIRNLVAVVYHLGLKHFSFNSLYGEVSSQREFLSFDVLMMKDCEQDVRWIEDRNDFKKI